MISSAGNIAGSSPQSVARALENKKNRQMLPSGDFDLETAYPLK
jgi:hypothetical protein